MSRRAVLSPPCSRVVAVGVPILSVAVVVAAALGSDTLADDRYPPATFGDLHEGSLNISVFTFRDLNRNGRYDLGDLPMAGLLVDATSEGLPEVTRRSNGSGFANFEMSATDLR